MIYTDITVRETLKANEIEMRPSSYITCAGTTSTGMILKNLKNSTETNLTGTSQTVHVDLNGTTYYFTVYPSKD